jgi:hypothetical protein
MGGRRAGEIRVKGVEYVGEGESLKYITRDGGGNFNLQEEGGNKVGQKNVHNKTAAWAKKVQKKAEERSWQTRRTSYMKE